MDEPSMLRTPDYLRQAVWGIPQSIANWWGEGFDCRGTTVLNDLVPPYCCSYNGAAPILPG